jgi:phosphatidate cytidylyltransferase
MIKKELTKRVLSSLILAPIVLFVIIEGNFIFNFFIFVCFVITAYEWLQMSKQNVQKIFGLIFIIISFYSIFKIRNDFNQDYFHILLIAIICVSTDLGGYIFGKLLKGPKLTKLSPNKTYAGVFGSFLLAIIITNLFIGLTFDKFNYKFTEAIFIFVLIISLVSQIGDIIISYFKRRLKIKDTGNIIPGHGGILDRIDGMIFSYPFSYIFFLNWNFQ